MDRPCTPTGASPPTAPDAPEALGGEAACWVHLVCPECDALAGETHAPGCSMGAPGDGDD